MLVHHEWQVVLVAGLVGGWFLCRLYDGAKRMLQSLCAKIVGKTCGACSKALTKKAA